MKREDTRRNNCAETIVTWDILLKHLYVCGNKVEFICSKIGLTDRSPDRVHTLLHPSNLQTELKNKKTEDSSNLQKSYFKITRNTKSIQRSLINFDLKLWSRLPLLMNERHLLTRERKYPLVRKWKLFSLSVENLFQEKTEVVEARGSGRIQRRK